VTLRLSYFVPPAPLLDAQARGLLEDVDLEEVQTTGSPAQLAGLRDGTLDVVVTAIDNLFEWRRAGVDLRLVAQVESTTTLGIFAEDSVGSLAGLSGRRFAVDAFTNGFALVARYLLGQADVEVEWVEVGGVKERLEALLSGDAEATLLGPPFDRLAREAGKKEIVSVQETFPAFPGQGLVVRGELLDTPELRRLLGGLGGAGLLPVDTEGLDVLTHIRDALGLLPADIVLRDLLTDDLRFLLSSPPRR
jgi:ABC-type nitrate/sulfonate/bicarbonate transport system substrate-binding protein